MPNTPLLDKIKNPQDLKKLQVSELKTLAKEIPLWNATLCGALIFTSASIVAFTTLCGFELPLDFASTSCTPADSKTARIAPPAINPVPGAAGLIKTKPPENLPNCS